jgi:hypothetical protein
VCNKSIANFKKSSVVIFLPTLVGADLSKRVGMGDLASPLPFMRQGKTGSEKLDKAVLASLGASYGMMQQIADGLGEMASGDFAKGAEKVLPLKVASNMIRTARYADEGLTNKNGEQDTEQDWRDHRATFEPEKSEEWKRWTRANGKPLEQAQFAAWLEENLKDIIPGEGLPTGGEMLALANDFEAKQDMRLKSSIRLQSGGVRLEFVEDEDKGTLAAMRLFEKFQIAVPVFRADEQRYPVTARLRYRPKDGKVTFWYELIRHDLVMEQAARNLVEFIRGKAGMPFFFGNPFAA